jgi:S-methylmethionine-dependent homocysteine/selenocysteine methylase
LPLTPGENVSVLKKRNDFNQEKFVNFVLECINEGASIVGGCCEVSPEYISAINNKIFNLNK